MRSTARGSVNLRTPCCRSVLVMKTEILCVLFAAILHARTEDISLTSNDAEILRNVLVTESGSVILGSNLTLRRLDSNLQILQTVNLLDGQVNRLLSSDPGGTYSDSFIACERMNCELLDDGDITNQRWRGSNVLRDGSFNAHGLFVQGPWDGRSVFTAALRNERAPEQASQIVRGRLDGVDGGDPEFGLYTKQVEDSVFTPREFLAVFEHEGFSYFVNKLTIQGGPQIRLVRLCNNDSAQPDTILFASYFEIRLVCDGENTVPTAAAFSPSDARIIVSVSSETHNSLCAYDLSEIHRLMTERYNDCRAGIGQAGLERSGGQSCEPFDDIRLNSPDINECNLVSDLLPSQEVTMPLSANTVISQPLSGGQFTSLLHSTLDGVQFLFAGTDTGKLHQYHVSSSSTSLIRTCNLVNSSEVGVANITQLTVTSDGLTLYALSPFKLVSHAVDVCDSYKSCDSCLGAGRDPICGWCALENRCSREADCGAESAVWVSDSMSSCPVISSAEPSIIYLRELQRGINISLATANIPDDGQTYQCCYNFDRNTAELQTAPADITMETMFSVATRNGNEFTCPVPTGIPSIPNKEDALLSNLSLRFAGNDVAVLSPPIRFADCSVHTNCTSCIHSDSSCHWCPFTLMCISSRDETCPGQQETAVTSSCPKLLPSGNANDNYLIHINYLYGEAPLVIKAENLNEFSESFQNDEFRCVIRSQGGAELFRTPATLLGGGARVRCEPLEYVFDDSMARLETTLDVEWTTNQFNIDNPSNAGVTLYSCSRLGSNCAQCLSVADYNCQFCDFSCSLSDQCSNVIETVEDCDFPIISSVSPNSGPPEGGTMVTVAGDNLGSSFVQLERVEIAGIPCQIVPNSYQPGISLQCVTGATMETGSYSISVNLSYLDNPVMGPNFTFKTPSLSTVSPVIGPRAGGTTVTITGNNLDIGTSLKVSLAGQDCYVMLHDEDEVTCISSASDETKMGVVEVAIDNWSGEVEGQEYKYAADPTLTSVSPRFSFTSGGTVYMIEGTNLHIVQEPRLQVHIVTPAGSERRRRRQTVEVIKSPPCIADSVGTRMTCLAPPIPSLFSNQLSATVAVEMDALILRTIENQNIAISIALHSDPRFQTFSDQSFSSNEEISLTIESQGSKFVFTVDMVEVLITPCSRDQCSCIDITFQDGNTSLTCVVETTSGLSRGSDLTVTVRVGLYNQTVGTIEIAEPLNIVVIVAPIAVMFVAGMIFFAVVVFIFCYKAHQKDSRYKELIVEMEKLESSVARECKQGFAELQTDLDELTGDLSGYRLPYHDLQAYLLAGLFPGCKDHPVLHPVQLPVQRQISSQRAIRDFHNLCMDKKVMLTFIRTLEEQRNFTIRDKSIVGSLLMIALHGRLDYATEILKTLMSDLIHRAVAKSSPKLLLRRTESVAEKMLTNWLAFCLHGYIVEQAGKPLYLLYRAVKSQLEKGPIDVITGEARYSLSEHKLIRQKMDVEVLTVTVEADDGLRIPVKVLDCDTISQVKEKMLDVIYKATPVSNRPALTSIDLEYLKSPRDYLLLRDEDMTTVTEGGWKGLNTLRHYGVVDGGLFRLLKRRSPAPPGQSFDYPASLISSHAVRNRALSEAEDGTRVWHLFKQHDVEDPRRSPFMNKKMITEVYLPRMLSTKNILQSFVDGLFNSLFSVTHPPTSPITYSNFFPHPPGTQAPVSYAPGGMVPMAVKYLLDFLDDAAESAQISERDVVHTWKNNALALRFWVTIMKNPEFVFDINKSHTVDACLSVIAQAFIDGCSYTDIKLTIDSPTSKLLYNKDVREYKAKVRQYYQSVARLPRIPEDAMQSYLKQLSEHQAQMFRKTGGFVVESALYELLRYGNKYSEQLLSNLRAAGLESRAQVFESVVRATS